MDRTGQNLSGDDAMAVERSSEKIGQAYQTQTEVEDNSMRGAADQPGIEECLVLRPCCGPKPQVSGAMAEERLRGEEQDAKLEHQEGVGWIQVVGLSCACEAYWKLVQTAGEGRRGKAGRERCWGG
eukprot:630853-Hanusia_phi.AAC.1